ncbi:tRNA (N6-threonylcarbamoyladenosine(37)-N6)-methyltransferase TrmO [Alteromonas sediminis]|uniref:tRNA (N6-threonylcarbamoyladenosine(37)-N6)-methyltransferase TrmO n=1 Tax=Alteromonas sediminis TaxID=2259342 RepID=A0A3N5XZX8_9ALTE|nr:tRNA (N6-threonylcarbamoyladenosine(37)-N6)-methyltransferase TrmO [Alteromonas sediminis]RPJ65646.1 tRNA (N6-threonylcarbamoyladenosine(37)-N6)-methyltransferase TrmO [Alteromonas sediminis]
MTEITIHPIGYITTPFKQKFGIPRQPNLANAKGVVTLSDAYSDINVFKGLSGYSHVWLLFQFSETIHAGWQATVKAPRLGGNAKLGVFASRSTHRPNGIGMSVVTYLGHNTKKGRLCLEVSGVDLLDNTPIIDIKPYIPYADAINGSHTPFDNAQGSAQPKNQYDVHYTPRATQQLAKCAMYQPDLPELIDAVLSQDPRPAYKKKKHTDNKRYGCQLYDWDIIWRVSGQIITVENIRLVASPDA